MDIAQLPLLLYLEPVWSPCPWVVYIYLQEKKISQDFIWIVPHLSKESSNDIPQYLKQKSTAEIAGGVKHTSADFPKIPGSTVPKLAVPKEQASATPTDQSSYTWLSQHMAIVEYIEDLCDIDSRHATVSSLRGGNDPIRRARVRALLYDSEDLWSLAGTTLMFGSPSYNKLVNKDCVHPPSAHAVKSHTDQACLKSINDTLGLECDFEGVAEDREGAATIADITLYAFLVFWRDVHGCDLAKGYQNIEKLIEAFEKRKSSTAGVPEGGYPAWAKSCRDGWPELIWERPDFDRIDARFS